MLLALLGKCDVFQNRETSCRHPSLLIVSPSILSTSYARLGLQVIDVHIAIAAACCPLDPRLFRLKTMSSSFGQMWLLQVAVEQMWFCRLPSASSQLQSASVASEPAEG